MLYDFVKLLEISLICRTYLRLNYTKKCCSGAFSGNLELTILKIPPAAPTMVVPPVIIQFIPMPIYMEISSIFMFKRYIHTYNYVMAHDRSKKYCVFLSR